MSQGVRRVILFCGLLGAMLLVGLGVLTLQAARLDAALPVPAVRQESIFLGEKADHLLDHGRIGVIDNTTLPGILQRMKPNEGKAPGVGLRYYEGARLWLSMVVPPLLEDRDRWVIRLENTRIREARIALVRNGVIEERVWRYDSPERRAGLSTRVPLFEFGRADLEDARILMGFNSLGAMRAAVYVDTIAATAAHETWQALKYGLLTGFLLALAIYLLVIGTRIGERSLIFAAGLSFFAGVFIAGVGGYIHASLLAPWPHAADALLYGTQPVMMTFWVLLVVAYLGLVRRAPVLACLLVVVAMILPLQGILTVATLLGYPLPFITDNGTPVLVGLVAGLLPLVWYAIKGDGRALRLLACFTPVAVATSVRLGLYLVPSSQPSWVALFEGFIDVVITLGLLAIVIVLDIQRREAALRSEAKRNELRFRDYAEISADGVFEVGPDGAIRSSAGPLSRALDMPAGRDFRTALAGLPSEVAQAMPEAPRRAVEIQIGDPATAERWLSLSSVPITDEDGRPDGFRAVVSDITDSVAERANEARRNTLAALGQLAGGIAHEVNNLLHPIISLSRRVSENHVEDPDGKRLLDLVVTSGIRAGEIVKSVLRAYTPESFAGAPVPLDTAVRDAVETIRATLPSTCTLDVRIVPVASPDVRVGEMIQVLSNLASNAIRATEGAGTLTIRLEQTGDGPVLSFADDGRGMPDTVLRRATEPFVTGSADGVGLGLSVVRRIVLGWAGALDIVSKEGGGTTILIRFPKASQ
jgi:signal transduction histidine kinase